MRCGATDDTLPGLVSSLFGGHRNYRGGGYGYRYMAASPMNDYERWERNQRIKAGGVACGAWIALVVMSAIWFVGAATVIMAILP